MMEWDWRILPLVLGFALLWVFLERFSSHPPSLSIFSLEAFRTSFRSLKQLLASWPRRIAMVALGLFLLALLDPRIYTQKDQDAFNHGSPPPNEGIAIYFILDQSGSMEEKALVGGSNRRDITKLELLKQVTRSFIEGDPQSGLNGRPNDMIGLVSFARSAQVLSPLTLDHQEVIRQLDKLDIMRIKDQDGTGIGYAIYKTANLIAATRHFAENLRGSGKPAYEIKDAVMILVTDGMQDPNPLDQDNRFRWMDPEQAALFAKQQHIRLYVVSIDPQFSKPDWAANRRQMERVAETTGGHFYSLDTSSNISKIYQEIDRLEKSTLPKITSQPPKKERPDIYQEVSLYPYLIAGGGALFLFAFILQASWLRVIP